jgi:hypothetical protein
MINTSKANQDYVVFVDSKALRGRSKAEYLRQVRKLGTRHPERSLKQISERMVFDHLIYLREKEKLRPSTLNQAPADRQRLKAQPARSAERGHLLDRRSAGFGHELRLNIR